MKPIILKRKRGKQGGCLGFKTIELRAAVTRLLNKNNKYAAKVLTGIDCSAYIDTIYYIAICDGELDELCGDDLMESLEDYEVQKWSST